MESLVNRFHWKGKSGVNALVLLVGGKGYLAGVYKLTLGSDILPHLPVTVNLSNAPESVAIYNPSII